MGCYVPAFVQQAVFEKIREVWLSLM